MAAGIQQASARTVFELARRQHGVVARAQLLELGVPSPTIDNRLRQRRLHLVSRGVYAVGRPHLNQLGRWMAAVLACGPQAVLSHESAAGLWGIRPLPGSGRGDASRLAEELAVPRGAELVDVSVPSSVTRPPDRGGARGCDQRG
jgi:hypothetical protein